MSGQLALFPDLERPNISKAARAMLAAVQHFRCLGYYVSKSNHPCATGIDLNIRKPNTEKLFSVEVKAVGFSRGAWRTRGRHNRSGDDFIAFVFPNGVVHVEDHRTHEKVRCKDGGRHLTRLAKLYL